MSDINRAFIALPLPGVVIDALSEVQHCLAAEGVRARWVRPEGIHLTLKFLGRLVSEKVEAVNGVLDTVATHHPPLRLTVMGLGAFPNHRRPRVLWAGIGGETERLGHLQQDIESDLSAIGWPCDKRMFKGHLTLARTKGQRSFQSSIDRIVAQCEPRAPLEFVADKLVLFNSRLRPGGAIYDKCRQRILSGLAD